MNGSDFFLVGIWIVAGVLLNRSSSQKSKRSDIKPVANHPTTEKGLRSRIDYSEEALRRRIDSLTLSMRTEREDAKREREKRKREWEALRLNLPTHQPEENQ